MAKRRHFFNTNSSPSSGLVPSLTFGCDAGKLNSRILPKSSAQTRNCSSPSLHTLLMSVPSKFSGQMPIVSKLTEQFWVAHSRFFTVLWLVIWRQSVGFPVGGRIQLKKLSELYTTCTSTRAYSIVFRSRPSSIATLDCPWTNRDVI